MKTLLNKILILLSISLIMGACTEDMKYRDGKVTPVETVYEPQDGKVLNLVPSGSLYFSWEPARVADNGPATYEIIFDKVGGDFSNPIYAIPSDNIGSLPGAALTHVLLNNVGGANGAEVGEVTTVIWTVRSSRGMNRVISKEVRELTFKRLTSIPTPDAVFITGAATEVGATLTDALPLKAVTGAAGTFEIYTKLTAGQTYKFASKNEDAIDLRTFYYDVAPGVENTLKEVETGTPSETTASTTGVYRITLNFTTSTATLTEITKVSYYYPDLDQEQLELTYQGQGYWKGSGLLQFTKYGWGIDERYKFIAQTKTGTVADKEEWGTLNGTDSGPSDSSPESYYFIKVLPVNSDHWANKWKFHPTFRAAADAATGHKLSLTMEIFMQGDKDYTHTVALP